MLHITSFPNFLFKKIIIYFYCSQNYNRGKHFRALFICAFLVFASSGLMTYLWQTFSIGTWLFAISAFCIEVIVKVLISIIVNLLFLYDQYYQEGTWEALDDAVYYVKSFGNTVEFCFALFLFMNGVWIFIFETGGIVRAGMMVIHAYCNIWCEARDGWKTFIKRRTAMSKINSLPSATEAQLWDNDDVCPICYMEMRSAKVTTCNHLFHGSCLQKWLYVEDACPLCHSILYKTSQTSTSSTTSDQANNNAAAAAGGGGGGAQGGGGPSGQGRMMNIDPVAASTSHSNTSAVQRGEDGELQIFDPPRQNADVVNPRGGDGNSSDEDELIYDSIEDYDDFQFTTDESSNDEEDQNTNGN